VSSADYQLGASGTVAVKIYDANNNLVRTVNVGSQDAGKYSVNWDGRNDSGTKVGDGTYSFKVEAVDGKGNALDVTTTISGTVYSYRLDQGTAYLILNGPDGIKLPTGDIIEVSPS
jgi:flagellar basal-body rod modification protein FlgD